MLGYDDLVFFQSIREYRHPDRECELLGVDLQESGFLGWILREVIDPRELIRREYEFTLALADDPFDRCSRLQRTYMGVELVERRILEEGEVMEHSFGDTLSCLATS